MVEKKRPWFKRHATAWHVGLTMFVAGCIGIAAFIVLYNLNSGEPLPANVDPAQHIYYLAGTVVFVLGILTAAGAAILQFRKQKSNEETVQNEKDKLKLAQREAEYNWAITEQQIAENKRIADAQSEADLDAKYADRLARAIDHLGHEQESIRKGAIYELKLLARDSEKDRVDVVEILTSFVREKAREVTRGRGRDKLKENLSVDTKESNGNLTEVPADLMLALSVLSALATDYAGNGDSEKLMVADLEEIDFSRFNLYRLKAYGLNLRGAILGFAHLRFADLRFANLRGANLSSAVLMNTNLISADLRFADLWNADLRGADLGGANLTSAVLTNANLTSAVLTNANLVDANLRRTIGLTKQQLEGALFDKDTTKIDEGLWKEMFPGEPWPWGEDGEVDDEGGDEGGEEG